MLELVHVNRADRRYSSEDLSGMLAFFRKNNQLSKVTGLLLYDGYGTFIQALEWASDVVLTLYEKICSDERHSRINLLGKTTIDERSFPDWRMGFKNLYQSLISNMEGYSDFLQQPDRTAYLNQQKSFALDLLDYFKNNNKTNLDKG